MGEVGDLVGHQGAAAAGMLGPAEHAGLEEGAVDDQLTAAVEQVEQARLALRPVELVLLLHRHPRHPPTLGGQRVTGAGQVLLLHEQLLARSLPLLRRHDRGRFHCNCSHRIFLSLVTGVTHAAPRWSARRYWLGLFRALLRLCLGGMALDGPCFSIFFDAQQVARPQLFEAAHPALINLPDRHRVQ